MAEKPAKKSSPARAPKVVAKKTSLLEANLVTQKSQPKKSRTLSATRTKRNTDDELRQAVAQRVVRRIFDEIGQPEALRVRVAKKRDTEVPAGSEKVAQKILGSSTDEAVVLPSNASPRVLSKATALQAWYRKRFPQYVAKGATGFGIVFLFFGSLGVIQFTTAHFPPWQAVQTALLCGSTECSDSLLSQPGTIESHTEPSTISATGLPVVESIPSPAVSFIAKPPTRIEATATFVVRAEFVTSVEVLAQSKITGKYTILHRSSDPVGSDHTYQIVPDQFLPGEYDLRARAIAARDGKHVYVTGPRFIVPPPEVTATVDAATETATDTEALDEQPLDDATPLRDVPLPPSATATDPLAPVIETVVPSLRTLNLTITRPEPGVALLSLIAPEAMGVELYAQRSNATAPYFVASAQKVGDGKWLHRLVLTTLPAGNYYITARVKTPGEVVTTRGVVVEVSGTVPLAKATTTLLRPATIDTTDAIQELKTGVTPPPLRTQYAMPESAPERTSEEPPVPTPRPVETAVADPIIKAHFESEERNLNDLLKRYASAYQSGDVALQEMIDDELVRKRAAMVEAAVQEGDTSVAAIDLDESIAKEFTRLKERVETFESLLRERSGNSATIDTDSDGITDYDEEMLYDTDPTTSDSDGDGIADGAEIMRGYDPLNSAAETVLAFTSPKEFGLVRDDVLKVESVTPVIETDTTRGQPPIQAQIKGMALPNSYVTLFIYSTPVVVTVKTDADGSFVYQFDKELEDGSHEVYVAVTDNTGDIIAKSSAFSFIKQAEAFTVTDAQTTPVVPSTEVATPTVKELYNMVLAMGVLAFGLILLIFGIVMRREPVIEETVPAATTAR